MRRRAVLALTTVMVGGALVVGPAGQLPAQAGPQGGGPQDSGIEWEYSQSADGYYRDPPTQETGGGGPSGPATVLTITGPVGEWLRCDQSDPAFLCSEIPPGGDARDTDVDFGVSGILCPEGPSDRGRPEYAWLRFSREIEDGEPTRWYGEDADCSEISDDDFIPIEEFSTTIDCQLFQPLGDPPIAMNPDTTTFVNWPTIVSTDYPVSLDGYTAGGDCENGISDPVLSKTQDSASLELTITIDRPGGGLTGTVNADAVYEWTFHDGENTASASGRGRPYQEGTYPKDNPGYYLTHEFATTGAHDVTLTVGWTGTVTVHLPDLPDRTDPIDPVEISSTVPVDVDEAKSVLVR